MATIALTLAPPVVSAPRDPGDFRNQPSDVLLLGDSVMAGISRSEQGKAYLQRRFTYIFGAVGCQRLITEGCTESAKDSALQVLSRSAKRVNRAVVIATGYNDYANTGGFRQAVTKITAEARKRGVIVVWLTYRERGNVKVKAASFNVALRAKEKDIDNLFVLDWNKISRNEKDWFAADGVHLKGIGPYRMTQTIADYLKKLDEQGLLPDLGDPTVTG